jgi:outer membrane scaffolding protein for murein synthesis (MipA/OmpV family)
MHKFTPKLVAALASCLLLFSYLPAHAAQEVARIPFINAPSGTAGLGGGFRFGNSPYISSGENTETALDLIPLYLYEGEYLYAHGTSGGIHIIKNENFTFSALARLRFQQLDPDTDPLLAGLNERFRTVDAGLNATYRSRFGEFSIEYVADALNKHQGQEVQATYRYDFTRGAWSFSPFFSWGLQNSKLANYYFGVSAAEATPERPEYEVGDAQFFTFGLNTSWQVTERILLFGNIGFGGADDAVKNSPIVEDPSFSQAFVGGTYMFGNVMRPTAGEERAGEWSWRVNYGYQADGNIIGTIDQGDFSRSEEADTHIGGITLGRLLTDGKRIDYVGKIALYRHFEDGVTSKDGQFTQTRDFNSYAAYIMAIGRGYSPWTGDELFRWGFGFGMSYAEEVPLAEQAKQIPKGKNTSNFLNYLELQLDFPLRRVSKANWLQNCYLGATVVHRSGIFGTSNLLGDVSGGSDWITAHLECVR